MISNITAGLSDIFRHKVLPARLFNETVPFSSDIYTISSPLTTARTQLRIAPVCGTIFLGAPLNGITTDTDNTRHNAICFDLLFNQTINKDFKDYNAVY